MRLKLEETNQCPIKDNKWIFRRRNKCPMKHTRWFLSREGLWKNILKLEQIAKISIDNLEKFIKNNDKFKTNVKLVKLTNFRIEQ